MKKNLGSGMMRNGKRRGEWVELVFAVRAMREGLELARPWGESLGYDYVVVQRRGRMARVQVKSTMFKEGTGYSCSMKDSKGPYKKGSFEFVAAYVIPEDVWFIIPEKKVRGKWSVGLYPKLEGSKYGEYLEAWDLLRGDTPGFVERIEACAEEGDFL
jgi:PD-(D/E)XK endonuclease